MSKINAPCDAKVVHSSFKTVSFLSHPQELFRTAFSFLLSPSVVYLVDMQLLSLRFSFFFLSALNPFCKERIVNPISTIYMANKSFVDESRYGAFH